MDTRMSHVLLLASKSPSRVMLLTDARIPFVMIPQNADETSCDIGSSFSDRVMNIALHKMENVILVPGGHDGEYCFVLTADTMVRDSKGVVHGKPVDRADAIKKIKGARAGSTACTAFCLDKKVWRGDRWSVSERITRVVLVDYLFDVPDEWLDRYFDDSPGLGCAGGAAVEHFGSQFLRSVQGSHSALIGLPLFELREALESLGFFNRCR
jgi:septum formation protein